VEVQQKQLNLYLFIHQSNQIKKKKKNNKRAATTKFIVQSRYISDSRKQVNYHMYKYFIACHVGDIQFVITSCP